MKILIIGEYSGFSKNLCKGLLHLGHDACAFNWGDTFKQIKSERGSITININNYKIFGINIKGSHYIRRFFSYIRMKRVIYNKKQEYDCALIVNPTFIKHSGFFFNPYPTIDEVKLMLKSKDMIFLSACGNDFIFNSYLPYREKTSQYYREKYLGLQEKYESDFLNVLRTIKGVIPVMCDYADAYRWFQDKFKYRLLETIPIAYEIEDMPERRHRSDVIHIIHGVTRAKEKGSDIVIEALNDISSRYGSKVDINIVSNISLEKYLEMMKKADILIDQCYAYSYGLNALEALSMGIVVLSGNEPNNAKEFGVDSCPVVNIRPTVKSVTEELDRLIQNPHLLESLSIESQKYAKKIHDSKKVAHQYISIFKEELKTTIR